MDLTCFDVLFGVGLHCLCLHFGWVCFCGLEVAFCMSFGCYGGLGFGSFLGLV